MSTAQPDWAMFHIVVFVIVQDEKSRVLLHKRAGTTFLPGYYDFPSGHVEYGESFAAAAVRELAEETGLTVREADLRLLQISQNTLDDSYVNIVYRAKEWHGTPTILEPNKCTDLRFFDIEGLPAKRTLAVRLMEQAMFNYDSDVPFIDLISYQKIMGVPFILA